MTTNVETFIEKAREAAAGIGAEMAESYELALRCGLAESVIVASFEHQLSEIEQMFAAAAEAIVTALRADLAMRRAELRARAAPGGRA